MKEYKEITKENFEDFIKNLSITELVGDYLKLHLMKRKK